ncbi:MAG: hypothetical protein WC207_04750 [Sphaerochaetaceae bacterium]|nr:hypothetical protein [Sphaerochaetaceae bacterium]HHU88572.1 hypothetical protein [Spirochaetales bacterium]
MKASPYNSRMKAELEWITASSFFKRGKPLLTSRLRRLGTIPSPSSAF